MQPGITVYFVRHGETDWNAERRYQGQRDIPLNAKGREQAKRNGETLRGLLPGPASLDFVASPLDRARETMQILRTGLGLAPHDYRTDDRLKELSYGTWEGQLQSDVRALDPESYAQRQKDEFHWRPEGGESYADLLVRVQNWLATVSRDTVVASHGGVSRCLQAEVGGLDPQSIPNLDSRQDRVLVLTRGAMRWV